MDSTAAWTEFKLLRNKINNILKYEERDYKRKQIFDSLGIPSKSWSLAKSYMNWDSNSGPPTELEIKGKLISKACIIASEMNDFFLSKVKTIRDAIEFSPSNFDSCKKIMSQKKCKLSVTYVTLSKVKKLLQNLNSSKSLRIDELDNYSLKVSAEEICRPVHHIVTLSLLQCKFPTVWKYSKIIPLHKKGSKLDRKNYRPVAILSPISKILEKIIFEQIYGFFNRNKIFHPYLHGYRENCSTQTALITMYDRWARAAAS